MRIPLLFLASFAIAVVAGLLIGVVRGLSAKGLPMTGLWVGFLTPNVIALAAVLQATGTGTGTGTEQVAVVPFAIASMALVSATFGTAAVLGLLASLPFRRERPPAPVSTLHHS